MKNSIKNILTLVVICFTFVAQAHNPDLSSTALVEQSENNWVLHIRAALTAFEYEVDKNYGTGAYKTPEEFNALVLEHVKKNTSIYFNEENGIDLENGFVKLGHETSVSFEVKGLPSDLKTMQLKNSSFSDIPRNQSALVILKKGFVTDKFMLDKKNGHTANIKVSDSKFIVTSIASKESATIPWLGISVIVLAFLSIFLLFKNREKFTTLATVKRAEVF